MVLLVTEFQEAFDVFDDNGDGKISREELAKMMTRLGQMTSEEEITNIMTKADRDCRWIIIDAFLWPSRRSSLYSKLATYLESQYSMLRKQSREYFQFYSSVGLGRGSLLSSN